MMRMLKEEADPRALGRADVFDTYQYQGGRKKGYETWLKEKEATDLEELKKKLEEPKKDTNRKKKGAAAD
jgi:hypothetical protein